jgi:hypothetical protein
MSGGADTVSIVADIGIPARRAKMEVPRVFRSWYKTPYMMKNTGMIKQTALSKTA